MLDQGPNQFAGKQVLLLQGPVGPFFSRLAADLQKAGARVYKVNFNAGDWLYYPRGALNYRGRMEDWPAWFDDLIGRLHIDFVLLYGDCRPIHRAAHAIAAQRGLNIGVFEEGYIRPDYITLERHGVNGYSQLSRDPGHYRMLPSREQLSIAVGNAYWFMVWYGFCYFAAGALGKPWFHHYRHHRPLTLLEGVPWIRSAWRKVGYRLAERGIQDRLVSQWSGRYFLVPLQVFNDVQITVHAGMDSVAHFIEVVLRSFAEGAPADTLLVFKHHPMDRGYRDYTALINRLVRITGTGGRVHYIHDQHLPTLFDHARGVVVVNSTAGMSALHHGIPTKVCGHALYDMPGLTFQGALDEFWGAAGNAKPDRELYLKFRNHLVAKTQLNGSYYKPLRTGSATGLIRCVTAEPAPGVQSSQATPAPGFPDVPRQGEPGADIRVLGIPDSVWVQPPANESSGDAQGSPPGSQGTLPPAGRHNLRVDEISVQER